MSITSGLRTFLLRPETFFAEYRPHESIDVPIAAILLLVALEIVAVAALTSLVVANVGFGSLRAAVPAFVHGVITTALGTILGYLLVAVVVHLVVRIVRPVDAPVSFGRTFGVVGLTALLSLPLVVAATVDGAVTVLTTNFATFEYGMEQVEATTTAEPRTYTALGEFVVLAWSAYIWYGGLVAVYDIDRRRLWWPAGVGFVFVLLGWLQAL